MKKHNFNPGPSILPRTAIENSAKAILELNGTGLSLLEISHRSKEFQAILDETMNLFKDLLNIPSGYQVIFLGGGASLQFCMVPYNLLNKKAAYLETGSWAEKAIKEAKYFGEVNVVASSKDKNYSYIPKNFSIPPDADYFHITTNNTIFCSEIHTDLDSPVPMVADMSSDILSRQTDISKYALIYGGAQKNLGPAGVTFVIIKEDVLGKVDRKIPSMLNYSTHLKEPSLYNTPPVFAIYTCLETLRWIKNLGGIKVIEAMNIKKANLLYDTIDNSKIFVCPVEKGSRSLMNIGFIMNEQNKDKEDAFLDFSKTKGMIGIKGHRSVGGFRASAYNAMPIESIQALVDCMNEFEKLNS